MSQQPDRSDGGPTDAGGPHDETLPGDAGPEPRRYGLYASAVLVAVFFVRVLGDPWDSHFPPKFPDALNPGRTDTYFAVASLTPFRPSFYWAPRPIGYPALLWSLARNSHVVVVVQMAAYCAAFGWLCLTARQLLRNRVLANATVVAIVLVAVQGRFAFWNTQILSESLAISLGVVALTAWWRVAGAPSPSSARWAWGFTIAWVLVRDSHAVPLAVGIVPAAAVVGWTARRLPADVRRRLLSGALIGVLVCGYVYSAARVSGRDRYSFYDNVGMRVLPDPKLRAWFVAGGMPLDAALLSRQGKNAFDDDRFFAADPSLARFRRWADGPGSRRMLLSLVVRAPDWYRFLERQWSSILAYDYDGYDSYGVLHRLPARMPFHLGGPGTPRALLVWLLAAAAALVLAAREVANRRQVTFAAVGLVLVLIELYTTFAADPLEVERHLAGPLVRLSVILLVSLAIGLDGLWQARPPAPAVEAEVGAEAE